MVKGSLETESRKGKRRGHKSKNGAEKEERKRSECEMCTGKVCHLLSDKGDWGMQVQGRRGWGAEAVKLLKISVFKCMDNKVKWKFVTY
jgi:hypothetical protein